MSQGGYQESYQMMPGSGSPPSVHSRERKCRWCNAIIDDGKIRCAKCGKDVENFVEEDGPEHIGKGLQMGVTSLGHHTLSGLQDFVQEPIKGAERDGAKGLFKGVLKGTGSMVSNTFTGVLDFSVDTLEGLRNTPDAIVNKMRKKNKNATPTYHHGVEAEGEGKILESYVHEKTKPKHVVEGLSRGLKSFATGVFQGAHQLVTQPVQGAQEGGFMGFAKGLQRGVSRAVTKTLAGTLDLATNTLEGIRTTPQAVKDSLK
eukprot:GILK01003830.1.p1 GENE.GILK01003830.1~~GILK01003830.1.p1  ORF type:complete len:259 (-),score=25.11 GILK01003830.1:111-887(-)